MAHLTDHGNSVLRLSIDNSQLYANSKAKSHNIESKEPGSSRNTVVVIQSKSGISIRHRCRLRALFYHRQSEETQQPDFPAITWRQLSCNANFSLANCIRTGILTDIRNTISPPITNDWVRLNDFRRQCAVSFF